MTIAGCKKKDNVLIENKPLTENEKLLTAHGWHMSLDIEDGQQHDLNSLWSLDDCWFFYPDRTFVYSYGTQLRPPGPGGSPEKNLSGTWELVENETILTWTTTYPYNSKVSDPIKIKSDTMIVTIITQEINRILIYTNCQ
jgi:hypothetical protein